MDNTIPVSFEQQLKDLSLSQAKANYNLGIAKDVAFTVLVTAAAAAFAVTAYNAYNSGASNVPAAK